MRPAFIQDPAFIRTLASSPGGPAYLLVLVDVGHRSSSFMAHKAAASSPDYGAHSSVFIES